MTSVHLNSPTSAFLNVELKEEPQLQLFLSPHQPSASPCFNSTSQQFLTALLHQYDHDHDHHHQEAAQAPPSFPSCGIRIDGSGGTVKAPLDQQVNEYTTAIAGKCGKREERCTDGWLATKMRLDEPENRSSTCSETAKPVRVTVKFQDHHEYHSTKECNSAYGTNSTRVCSDCNTTTTPLWRSGPQGPKSLCNACGIRQRKARRAMAAAAAARNGGVIAMEASSTMKTKFHKEKRSRPSHAVQCKKVCNKLFDHSLPSLTSQKQLCFKNFARSLSKNSALQQVFSRDVEEAAVLLMELSCGFNIHNHC